MSFSSICIGIGNGIIILLYCFSFYILLETIILTVVYVAVVLGLGLVTGILYGFDLIIKGFGNLNIICFCNYNRNYGRVVWSIGKEIGNGNIIRF